LIKKGTLVFAGIMLLFIMPCFMPSIVGNPDSVTIRLYPTDDAFIDNYSTNNAGSLDYLIIRNEYGTGGSDVYEYNAFIKFDISSITTGISISSATMHLFYYDWFDSNPIGRDLNLYRVISNWDEDTLTGSSGPLCASVPTTHATVSGLYDWMTLAFTSDVQDIVDGTLVNYDWKIMDENYWGSDSIPSTYAYSTEYGDYVPYLEIEYEEHIITVTSQYWR